MVSLAHHGSRGNTNIDYLNMIKCNKFLVTVNTENNQNLTNKETLARVIMNPHQSCAFISLDMTLKNRVFLSMLLAIMLMFYESSIVNINKRYNFKFLFLCLSLVIMIMNLKYMKQINNTRQSTIVKIERWNDTINLLSKLPKKSLILQIGGVMPLEGINPFRVNIANIKLIMLGWLTNIPFDINYYNSHIDVTKDNIYCYTKNCPYNEMIDNPFFSSLRERYKKDIYYESLYSKSNHQIIKVITKIKN